MNKKLKNIEQLYSESFSNFRVEPSSVLWKSISSKLAWRNFFTFNPTTLNAYYVAGILAVSVAGALWITKPVTDNNQENKDVSINNTIEKPFITTIHKAQEKTQHQVPSTQHPAPSTPVKYAPLSHFTGQAQNPAPSNQQLVTSTQNPEPSTQETDSGINDQSTQYLAPRTQYPEPSTRKLATPHPKPHTQNLPRTQNPEPSTMFQDPWPNTMDSLFFSYNPTTPEYLIKFPNAFIPNPNGPTNGYYNPGIPNNNVFHPVYKGVVEYHLRIFNRHGELIFECNDINTGWDGYINDRLAAQGVYIWKARGRYSNGEGFIKFGNIMLIKK